jgi:4-hydroxy-4-methyl-2-oxoglutarate aldolase
MTDPGELPIAGDVGVGEYVPPVTIRPAWPRVSDELLQRIRSLPAAASTASDLLDELGVAMVSDGIFPRHVYGVTAGHVLTLAYLPERRAISNPRLRQTPSRLAHHKVYELAQPGDVVVIDARGIAGMSVFGGMAASSARSAGVSGCIVDGGVRDLAEVRETGVSLWSRSLTPRTGNWRLEAMAINQAVMCGGVHVEPGDVAIADETGICFVPIDGAEKTLHRIVEVAEEEKRLRRGT